MSLHSQRTLPPRGTKTFLRKSRMTEQLSLSLSLCFLSSHFLVVVWVTLQYSWDLLVSCRRLPTRLHVLLCVKRTRCPPHLFFSTVLCLCTGVWGDWQTGSAIGLLSSQSKYGERRWRWRWGCSSTFFLCLLAWSDTDSTHCCWPSGRKTHS